MFFCLSCPVITPAFLIFIVGKYVIAIQNFRCFYTAHHDQPELLTTAAKLTILASLFPQLNFTLLMFIKQFTDEKYHSGSAVVPMTSFLFLVNLVSWTTAQKLLNWKCFTIKLFSHSNKPADPEANDDSRGYQDNYMNPYIAMNVDDP